MERNNGNKDGWEGGGQMDRPERREDGMIEG